MDIAQAVREAATPALVEELNLRGYHVMWKQPETPSASAGASEVTDLDRWLAVWEDLRAANRNPDDHSAINQLCLALDGLYLLLEPPSARVARKINADAKASSRT